MNTQAKVRASAIRPWAIAVAATIFPLIFVGQLVTTHDAGMAVPDWPGTFGYNLFLYPWTAWFYGPFDLFVEHGHRLLGALVGFLGILLWIASCRWESRRWVRRLCLGLLIAIISQGALGGARVLLDQRTAAMLHGCIGPLVFALAAFVVMVSSQDWMRTDHARLPGKWLARIAIVLFLSTIGQLFVGAQLRHAPADGKPAFFLSMVHTHVTLATVLSLLVLGIQWQCRRKRYRQVQGIRAPANVLLVMLVVQILLGMGTWIANYALPWVELNGWFANYTIDGKGFWESLVVTGHSATGSLLIVAALWFATRLYRRQWNQASSSQSQLSTKTILDTTPINADRRTLVGVGSSGQ